jgi:DNA polymerase V
MYALIDCNNFYASCERLFRPDLQHQPIVVLSNNDGCVIARSNESKALGIAMGEPYFKIKGLCQQHKIHAFSSNYTLYGDISHRVMMTIEEEWPHLEIY